jgi:hypothetical protein
LPPVPTTGLFLKKGRFSSAASAAVLFGAGFFVYLLWFSRTVAHLFLGVGAHTVSVGAIPASQFHNGPSGGQSQVGACRDKGARRGSGCGLEGFVAGEHVPGGDQDLARDGGLGGVAVAGAAADVEVELVPGVRFAPGVLGGFDGCPAEQP